VKKIAWESIFHPSAPKTGLQSSQVQNFGFRTPRFKQLTNQK
jgi:hypothetical protein